MIDTDKYEGHTEGPWTLYNSAAHGPTIAGKLNDADWQLIKDAPLILEDYKRLHRVLRIVLQELKAAEDVIQYALDMTSDDDAKSVFEDFLKVIE